MSFDSSSPFGLQSPGKKGIGFKSVFKITDTPIIHSAGWHFRFNARLKLERVNIKELGSNGKGVEEREVFHWKCQPLGQELGYIVPEIVPEEDMKFPGWTTEIRLPFKPELGNEEKAVLEQDFQALDGTLLLNLNKLRPGFCWVYFFGWYPAMRWIRGKCREVFGASAMQTPPSSHATIGPMPAACPRSAVACGPLTFVQ